MLKRERWRLGYAGSGGCACALVLCIAVGAAHAQTATELPRSRTYLATGIYEEGGQIHFERTARPTAEALGEWQVIGTPVGELIGLQRRGPEGREIRILDRTGRQVGTGKVPLGQVGIVTDKGMIALPEALHAPIRNHELGFYSLQGTLLNRVSEPTLMILNWSPQPNGRMVTVNRGPGEGVGTAVVYGPDGTVLWRYSWQGGDVPDATVTPDGRRLVLLQRDVSAQTTEFVILGPGNQVLQKHHLPTLYQVICSADSRHIAALGQQAVVMVDADTGALMWRKDEDIDFVADGGLRFDAPSGQLLVISAKRDPSAKRSRLSLRRFQVSDGSMQRADLGEQSPEKAPTVLDLGVGTAGETRVLLPDRVLQVPEDAWLGQ